MLLVAAGGGGDAITASMLAPTLGLAGTPVVLTYSWDRLLIDPLPGQRSADDFDGLHRLAPNIHEIVPTSAARRPAGSALPRLAAELPARLLLLDPSAGAIGMAQQITAAAQFFGSERVGLVDVGGDVLARGGEPGLRSPLADLLALAACTRTGLPCQLIVIGPGIDGEIDQATVQHRLAELDATQLASLGPDGFAPIRDVFAWHPSEATGLLAAAAAGERGSVETRDAGGRIEMTDTTTAVFAVNAYKALQHSPAAALQPTRSLARAAELVAVATGTDEVRYEMDKAARIQTRPARPPTLADLPAIDRHVADAAARGATHITVRRLAELAGVTSAHALDAFQALLAHERPDRHRPPLYRVTPPPS